MTRWILPAALLLLGALAAPAQAQTRTVVQGTVTDERGEPLPGASVAVEGTLSGAATNAAGAYRFETTASGEVTLVASFLGYGRQRQVVRLAGAPVTADFQLTPDALGFGELVVTGVVNPTSRLESSASITTLDPLAAQATAPRTTAEIFRTIPGIRAEASGGDGNTNIAVRGVPISAGGSKYLQLQEDGLPLFLFGDIAFATADIFLRADASLGRIEAVRGGAASTLASNSPAGIINFVSRDGSVAGGSVQTTAGLDFDLSRVDAEVGAPISDDLAFHIGGFYRTGSGTRQTGYTAERGGQIRANLTRRFANGYARLYGKLLNDRTPAYLPMPIEVSGTNASPEWRSIDGLSATRGTPHSVNLLTNFGLGPDGERRRANVADGMHPVSQAIGAEVAFDLGRGVSVENRGRVAFNRGRFVSPFTAGVGTTSDILAGVATQTGRDLTGATLTRADSGQPFTGGLLQSLVMFDTELENFDTVFNDARVSFALPGETPVSVTAGLFTGTQRIAMAWLWNSYLMEVAGDNASLIDITAADGTALTADGLFAYGAAPFGNCCAVRFNSTHGVVAPYLAATTTLGAVTLDGSVRYDLGRVRGVGSGGVVAPVDVNQDGTIQPVEEAVNLIDPSQRNPVNYDYAYASVSLGGSFLLSRTQAVFARASQGASAKADRAIFPSGRYVDPIQFGPKDVLVQAELGYKQQFRSGGLFVTGFYAQTTEEGGFEATTQAFIENDYRAFGVEIEGQVAQAGFDVRGAATVTAAEITSGANEGNRPRRQPLLMASLVPSYTAGRATVGVSLVGQTSAYAQDSNELVMPGYALVNGFATVGVADGLALTLAANNVFDAIGITESEEGAIVEGQVNYLRARSVVGRTISASLRYTF